MMSRNFVTFESTFPDDTDWDEKDAPVTPGGRGIFDALHAGVASAGWPVGPITQHSFYGWSFFVGLGPPRMHVLLQYPGPWLLIVTRQPSFLKRLSGTLDHRADPALLQGIHKILSGDGHFSKIRWYSRDDYQAARWELGADGPT